MNAIAWIGAGFVAAVVTGLLGLLAREAEGWVELAPKGLLWLARRRLPTDLRDRLYEEWSAELYAAVHDADGRPISRLVLGLRFAAGLLWAARSVAAELGNVRAESDESLERPPSPVADFAAALTASGGRVEIILDDEVSDGRRWLLPAIPDALGPDAMFMVDNEGNFYGVAFPERAGGSLQPVIRDGQVYVVARVEFSSPDDPARPALETWLQHRRRSVRSGG